MKPLRGALDKAHPLFDKGGKLEKLYPLYELVDTFLYTPGEVTKSGSAHVRDGIDLKRTMITVVIALTPAILMCLYNTGLQANQAMAKIGLSTVEGWRGSIINLLGIGYDPGNIVANFIHGALYFFPIFIVTQIAGGLSEVVFSLVRKHEVNEGFLVTGMLFPLTLPPTIPLWQVAVGIIFGVVFAKEVFGGTGKNFLNVALTSRAFLYFAYPAQNSGDSVWTATDGYSSATILGAGATGGVEAIEANYSWFDAFIGFVPGSLGETSVLAALIGAVIIVAGGVGSWRIMVGMLAGAMGTAALLWLIGSDTNPMFSVGPHWHLVAGSLAFGLVFMVTDPVSAAMTQWGKWIYGALAGVLTIVIRTLNPAYPEGVMLAILFGNVFAPLIDYYVVKANVKRRQLRTGVAA